MDRDDAEHELISAALEVEQIEVNLFRSKSLWLPTRGRGAFGGQVISQALVSATKSVEPSYGLHSLHCYFLLSASPAIPIIYFVERLREGKSYTTRSVKAVQSGKIIFQLLCSFHKEEPLQPTYQWPMPTDVKSLEDSELEEVMFMRLASREGLPEPVKQSYLTIAEERMKSPIAVRRAKSHETLPDGTIVSMFWMQARNIPKYGPAFQKCILSYLSDLYFISIGIDTLQLKRWDEGPQRLGMTSSLDHSIYFYDDDFDCGDGLLYVMVCPRAASGRAVLQGRLYTRSGSLVAISTQEAVIRANIRDPAKSSGAKL